MEQNIKCINTGSGNKLTLHKLNKNTDINKVLPIMVPTQYPNNIKKSGFTLGILLVWIYS